jgi:hypothetical protein
VFLYTSQAVCYHAVQNILFSRLLSKNVKNKTYKTFNLPECETWSLTLREVRRLRVIENRALWRIFGPKRDEVRKLHNEELHNLHSSLNIIRMIKSRRMKWVRHTAHMGEMRIV